MRTSTNDLFIPLCPFVRCVAAITNRRTNIKGPHRSQQLCWVLLCHFAWEGKAATIGRWDREKTDFLVVFNNNNNDNLLSCIIFVCIIYYFSLLCFLFSCLFCSCYTGHSLVFFFRRFKYVSNCIEIFIYINFVFEFFSRFFL